ncbi:unnamed protein product [Candidula unifasciata]|uniref:G-protein coupled receptors family 1 profile domain-containing protein n=1 Tax=Candidula unifasciata TaxID=100452 RepID=A0A8S3YQS2_9EUPU|nr:unnamed protein product [Candidula unifasciata]
MKIMSDNFTSVCVQDFKHYAVPFSISWTALSVLVIAQSLLITFIIWRSPTLHTNTNMLVLSVTASDIFWAVSCIINATLNTALSNNMVANAVLLDTFLMGVSYSSLMLSMNQLGVIAADRYINIVHPFFYIKHITRRRVVTIIICYWILAIVYGAIPLLVYGDTNLHCELIFDFNSLYKNCCFSLQA